MFDPNSDLNSTRLEQLTAIAYKDQWSPEIKINWKQEIQLPTGINKKTYINMVSQLYFAEEATISLLGNMIYQLPELQAKQYLCTQAIDEARHATIYKKYLEKLGDIAPISESLRFLFVSGLTPTVDPLNKVIALNVLMEGEAINQQNKRIETLPCPLFRDINHLIVKDESRHAAFGRIYTKEKMQQCTADQKDETYKWISSLWKLWVKANTGRYKIEGADVLQTTADELDLRWQYQKKIFRQIGLLQ